MESVKGYYMDLQCLSSMWLKKINGGSHKERLEEFYRPQAEACKIYACALTAPEHRIFCLKSPRPPEIPRPLAIFPISQVVCGKNFMWIFGPTPHSLVRCQMTGSGPIFCTDDSRCWQPAPRGCAARRA